jgi:hypothetical protein
MSGNSSDSSGIYLVSSWEFSGAHRLLRSCGVKSVLIVVLHIFDVDA